MKKKLTQKEIVFIMNEDNEFIRKIYFVFFDSVVYKCTDDY